jgi:hypothetical protein
MSAASLATYGKAERFEKRRIIRVGSGRERGKYFFLKKSGKAIRERLFSPEDDLRS